MPRTYRRKRRNRKPLKSTPVCIARASRRQIPTRAFRDVEGLWAAVDHAALAGVELKATQKADSWELQFFWGGERFGGYRTDSQTLVVAGSLQPVETAAEAVQIVLAMLGGSPARQSATTEAALPSGEVGKL